MSSKRPSSIGHPLDEEVEEVIKKIPLVNKKPSQLKLAEE